MPKHTKRAYRPDRAILCIPDLHHPFCHRDALEFVQDVHSRLIVPAKSHDIVFLGDEIDAHAFSDKHKRDPDGMSEGEEWQRAVSDLNPWMKAFKNAKLCTSNHSARPEIRAFNAGLPRAFYRSLKEAMGAPDGWFWADRWDIDGIIFEHGEGVSGAAGALRAAEMNRRSTVVGHLHSYAGIQWSHGNFSSIFGMNTGWLGDESAYAFRYAAKMRRKPSLGLGAILDGVPQWIPMILDSRQRWTGRVV